VQRLQYLLSSSVDIDVARLRASAIYDNCTSDDLQCIWFWRFLETADAQSRIQVFTWITGLPRCVCNVYAVSLIQAFLLVLRMPVHGNIRIVLQMGDSTADHLPDVHTCFGLGCIRLQKYTSFDQLQSKLLFATAEASTFEVA
jgi:hypothetical protein